VDGPVHEIIKELVSLVFILRKLTTVFIELVILLSLIAWFTLPSLRSLTYS